MDQLAWEGGRGGEIMKGSQLEGVPGSGSGAQGGEGQVGGLSRRGVVPGGVDLVIMGLV